MRNSLETRLGIFFVLAMCVSVLLIETIGGAAFFRDGYPITARFDTIHDLHVGDPVKLAGVKIGTVSELDLGEDAVVVTMKIDHDRQVRVTSKATVKFTGLMGQNFVDVDFGTPGGAFVDPAVGALLETVPQPDVNDLMARLGGVAKGIEDMTKSFGGGALQNVLGPLAEFLRDNSPKMSAVLDNMVIVSDEIAQGRGTIGRMVMDARLHDEAVVAVRSVRRSSDKINGVLTDMKDVTALARVSVNRLEDGQGTMGLLLKDEALYRESTMAMVHLREMMEKMNNGDGTVAQLINDADFLASLTLMLQKVEKVTDGLEDQGPLSIIGMAFGRFITF